PAPPSCTTCPGPRSTGAWRRYRPASGWTSTTSSRPPRCTSRSSRTTRNSSDRPGRRRHGDDGGNGNDGGNGGGNGGGNDGGNGGGTMGSRVGDTVTRRAPADETRCNS